MAHERIATNPFYVLELAPDCSRAEVERAGQKWLAMLEVGLAAAETYPTPLGGQPRTPDLVRRALDELRDPRRRLLHELWARLDPSVEKTLERQELPDDPPPWRSALAAFGFAPLRWGR